MGISQHLSSRLQTVGAAVTELSVTLIGGDANNDNSVDLLDLAILAEDFNTAPGEARWNGGRADFNEDSSVDIFDLDILAANFNKSGDP